MAPSTELEPTVAAALPASPPGPDASLAAAPAAAPPAGPEPAGEFAQQQAQEEQQGGEGEAEEEETAQERAVAALLARYNGLRHRGDGSGYKLPWDVRLRMPLRPGDKKANVDITRVRTAEEAAVAFDLGTAWRQLHPTAGGGAPPTDEYNFSPEWYKSDKALWARIRSARSLPQLRAMLTQLRDSGALARMAGLLLAGGGGEPARRATPPQGREPPSPEAAPASGRPRKQAAAQKRARGWRESPARGNKRGGAWQAQAQQPWEQAQGQPGQPDQLGQPDQQGAGLAPLEQLRLHLELLVGEVQQQQPAPPLKPAAAPAEVRLAARAGAPPPPPQQQQPAPGQGSPAALAALAALLGAVVAPKVELDVSPPQSAAAASLAQLGAALAAQLGPGGAPGAAEPAPPMPPAWRQPAAAGAWAPPPPARVPQAPAAYAHDALLQLLLAASQRPGGAAAGLTPELVALYLVALQRVPEPQQLQQAGIMELLLHAEQLGSVVALAAHMVKSML